MAASTAVPGTQFVGMVNGRAWRFEHNGTAYQIVSLNGSDRVALHSQQEPGGKWEFGHDRDTAGRSAHLVARDIYRDITAPLGVVEGRRWLVDTAGYTAGHVNAMSNDVVQGQVTVNHLGGWDGFLLNIGAK
jgi:hypothetical protein